MAIEQFGVDARLDLARLVGVEILLVAGIVGAAFGIDVAGEEQVLAVGREKHAIGFGAKIGDLFGVARRRDPSARFATTRRGSEIYAIRLESGDQRGRSLISPSWVICRGVAPEPVRSGHNPDLRRLLVRGDVDGLHGERHPAAVGRDLRIADSLQRHHGVGVERPLLRGEDCRGEEQEEKPAAHTTAIVALVEAGYAYSLRRIISSTTEISAFNLPSIS